MGSRPYPLGGSSDGASPSGLLSHPPGGWNDGTAVPSPVEWVKGLLPGPQRSPAPSVRPCDGSTCSAVRATLCLAITHRERAIEMTQPNHRPDRQTFIVHAGDAAEYAALPEWWGALDWDTESRSLRFAPDGGNWIDEGELPDSLVAAGCRLSEVAATMEFSGLRHSGLTAGQRVLLKPDAQPQDPLRHRRLDRRRYATGRLPAQQHGGRGDGGVDAPQDRLRGLRGGGGARQGVAAAP